MSINTRDLIVLERELTGNVHPAVLKALIKMSGDQAAMKQQIITLAGLFDRLVTNQLELASASTEMQVLMPHMQRMKAQGMEVGSDPTLTGEHHEG